MNKDIDFEILKFYWNRLTYWQKKRLRFRATFQTANENFLIRLLWVIAAILSSVTRGLPLSERRIAKYHFIHERRRQRPGGAVQATFLFIVATITTAAWSIAVQSPAHIAAPVIFVTIMFLNILLVIKPARIKSRSQPGRQHSG